MTSVANLAESVAVWREVLRVEPTFVDGERSPCPDLASPWPAPIDSPTRHR